MYVDVNIRYDTERQTKFSPKYIGAVYQMNIFSTLKNAASKSAIVK